MERITMENNKKGSGDADSCLSKLQQNKKWVDPLQTDSLLGKVIQVSVAFPHYHAFKPCTTYTEVETP